jgi:hypothetical protein
VRRLIPGAVLRRAGRELVLLSPFKAERTPSCYLHVDKGTWYCFATGQGGDVVRLAELVMGCDFKAALAWCREACGLPPEEESEDRETRRRLAAVAAQRRAERTATLAAEEAADEHEKRARAWAIWQNAEPAAGTLVETYLRARGIDCDALAALYGTTVPLSLRFHPWLDYRHNGVTHRGPAMVGLILGPDRTPTGLHRTWLRADGRGKASLPKAKLTLGVIWGSAGWLSAAGPEAIVGEGYETTLTVMAALARAGVETFALSACSLGNLAGAGLGPRLRRGVEPRRPAPSAEPDPERPGLVLPAAVRAVTILEDADGKDPEHMRALIARALTKFRRAGLSARVASPAAGCDFNDMARTLA